MKSKIITTKFINFISSSNKSKLGKILKPISLSILIGAILKKKNYLSSNVSYCDETIVRKVNNENKPEKIFESNNEFDKKYFTISANSDNNDDTIIYIFYNKENPLQEELKDIVNQKIKNYIQSKNFEKKDNIKVKIVDSSQSGFISKIKQSSLNNVLIDFENADNIVNLKKKENASAAKENYIVDKIENVNNTNEPLILVKSGMCLETFNSLSFVKEERITKNNNQYNNRKIDHSLSKKLDNLVFYYYCNEMTELREHFKFLDKPDNKIFLISTEGFIKKNQGENKELLDENKLKYLSLFKDKNVKILFVNNPEITKNLKLDSDLLYVYYPPKMPNIMKNVELFLQENQLTQRYEGVDLNKIFNNSPTNFMLKFNFFRDEIKINFDNLKTNFANNANESSNNFNFNKFERINLQKLFSFPKRQVRQLAVTDKSLFKKSWNEKNKTILYVWLPNWAFLKENLFSYILYEANHLFDEIQITNSKSYSQKNKLYDFGGMADDLPQLFIIQTGNAEKNEIKKVFAFNYFRFSNELQNYMSNKHPQLKLQTPIENLTNVAFINSKNFKEKILDDKKLKEFVLEIKHEGCPSCFMLGKMFDHLSLKFKKHKLDHKIKLFRIDTENDLRYLGDFAATPTYIFGKKNDKGEITFLSEMPKPEFIFRLKKYSNYDLSKIRYHPNLYFGFQIYQNKMFLKPDFDPDMDISAYV